MNIGIVGDSKSGVFGVSTAYMQWARQYGNVVVLTPDMGFTNYVDIVVLPGGADIVPTRYGVMPDYNLSRANPYLEYFETDLLPEYIDAGTPIFGVCRGMQAINIAFGGTLKLHMDYHPFSTNRDDLTHGLNEHPKIKVNSLHHQCIDQVGEGLNVIATHGVGSHKVIEAIIHKTLPIAGVQWHPEEIYDTISDEIMGALISTIKSK